MGGSHLQLWIVSPSHNFAAASPIDTNFFGAWTYRHDQPCHGYRLAEYVVAKTRTTELVIQIAGCPCSEVPRLVVGHCAFDGPFLDECDLPRHSLADLRSVQNCIERVEHGNVQNQAVLQRLEASIRDS